jgi:hypothetical protein
VLDRSFESSLLVTQWQGSSEGNILFPLDPNTGEALSAFPPLSLGHTFSYAISPDRQTLAVVSFPSESTYKGKLLLIDLPAWKTQHYELGLRGWVSSMVFSANGRQLAIAHGDTRHTLTVVNVEEGKITAQTDAGSFVSGLKFTESGEALMLYQPAIESSIGLTAHPPQVLLLAATDLTTRWSSKLEDVRDGIFPRDATVTQANFYEPGNAFYISPGLVFAPDRDALYVVHAETEHLTTVDFAAQTVQTLEIHPRLTWFERLLSLTAGIAHAKIADGRTRQAAISPDGEYLYTVGVNSSSFQDQGGNWQMEQSSLGLEIIQTRDGSRVDRIETDTSELSLSPDGRFLYLRNWGNSKDSIPWTEIYDTASGRILTRRTGLSAMPALLRNGKLLLVSTHSTAETSHHMSILSPDGSSVFAEWTAPEYVVWLDTR